MPKKYESLANITEGDLVERLMNNRHWRGRFIGGLQGIPSDVVHHLQVPLNKAPGSPSGDIDILLIPPGCPEQCIAIEVKRVKVSSSTFKNGIPNKLQELEKARRQANLLAKIGFAQVYCFILVVVDSRTNNSDPHSYDGLTTELATMINAAITTEGLDQRVGLIHFEFVQSINDEPLGSGTYGGHLKRLALGISQPSEITTWASGLVAVRNA